MKLLKISLKLLRLVCSIYIAYYALNMRTLGEVYLDGAVLAIVVALIATMILGFIRFAEDE